MRFLGPLVALLLLASPGRSAAQARAQIELDFVPSDRAQIAVWVEKQDGTFMGTLALTYAVATAGIGNRPGALQMNSGYRWPYGRREGVLPVWAHRRASAPGAKLWKRVIFQDRSSEGAASRTSADQSVDDYYCLSFDRETTGREALDAVTCASVFSSDKGRFITDRDVARGYAEPFEPPVGPPTMRKLDLWSMYPPRRNARRCEAAGCYDHEDLASFRSHASAVMPEIDAVSFATPAGSRLAHWVLNVPYDWEPTADYRLFIEVNVEGDYNETFNADTMPTPSGPSGRWDTWASSYGYPYRGQPSVVFSIPFRLDGVGSRSVTEPDGYGDIHGADGELRPMAEAITNDPDREPGSGADRLLLAGGARAQLNVKQNDACLLPDAPEECGKPCDARLDLCGKLVCGSDGTCQSVCVATRAPASVQALRVERYPERIHAHMWARMTFVVPQSDRPIGGFDVRVRPEGGDWDQAYTHDPVQKLLPVALDVCADPDDPMRNRCPSLQAGDEISVDLTGLQQQTRYEVSIAARDATCNQLGPVATASFATPAREFTTVSPCFVATAAYGSPLAQEISVLREVRDRYLQSHALGRALVRAYYAIGPDLAAVVRERPWLRDLTRAVLNPVVRVARWWLS